MGTFGDLGIVSCGPGKPLAGAAGGVLVTNSRDIYAKATAIPMGREEASAVARRTLSFWFWRRFPQAHAAPAGLSGSTDRPRLGTGPLGVRDVESRCRDPARADPRREANSRSRRRNVGLLMPIFRGEGFAVLENGTEDDVAVKLVLVLPRPGPSVEEIIARLAQAGIEADTGYIPLHLQRPGPHHPLPVTESLWNRIVCVPVEIGVRGGGLAKLKSRGNTLPPMEQRWWWCPAWDRCDSSQ